MKNRFNGEIKNINPELLLNKTKDSKVDIFFITLGTIFNEINSIMVFEKMLHDFYENPEPDEKSVHAGHYGGLKIYTQKIMASAVHEFFNFIKKNTDIFKDKEFNNVLLEIPKKDQELWGNLVAASTGKFDKVSKLLNSILKIRNNIGFHFDQSGKSTQNAFISRFLREDKSEKNDLAYYSLGSNLETRFYFSDAVEEEILFLNIGKKNGEILRDNEAWKNYQREISETIFVMTSTISTLLKKYIGRQRNKPR